MTLSRAFVKNAPTTPLDARLMDLGRVVCNTDGTPRTGVLSVTSAVALLVAAATMHVTVRAATFATSRGINDGVSIFANDGSVVVPITAAPISNSRLTVIWVKQNDDLQGDANALPVFGTTDGAAAATPTKPSIPIGAEELGTIRIYSGTTAANGGLNTLTETFRRTAMQGGSVQFRNLDELNAWTNASRGQLATLLDDTVGAAPYAWTGTSWVRSNTVLGTSMKTDGQQSGIVASPTFVSGILVSVTLARASNLRLSGVLSGWGGTVDNVIAIRILDGATIVAEFSRAANSVQVAGTTNNHLFSQILTAVPAGTHAYRISVIRTNGTGSLTINPTPETPVQLIAELVG